VIFAALKPAPVSAVGTTPLVDAVSFGTTNTATLTISHTTSGLERYMLVGVSIHNSGSETVSSITYNGASLSQVGFWNHTGA
jgi:hypothetical protein